MPKIVEAVTLEAGRRKLIHINKHVIAANNKHDRKDPPITCKVGKDNYYGHSVEVSGECRLIHSPDKPLKCGAKVWIETNGEVKIGVELPQS